MICAVADVVPVAGDRAVVDHRHHLVGVEAVNVDAGAVVAPDGRPGIVRHARGESFGAGQRASRDSVARTLDAFFSPHSIRRRWVTSPSLLTAHGYTWSDVHTISAEELDAIPLGSPIE